MNLISTFRELYIYDNWATQRLFDAAEPLDDAKLDHAFDLGFGTLRKTLYHILMAETLWLTRCKEGRAAVRPAMDSQVPVAQLRERWKDNHEQWTRFLSTMPNEQRLEEMIDYNDMKGNPHVSRLLDIVLHVINHGVYHRAQALNMLRHLGVKPPRIDFIFMHFESPRETPPALSRELVRYYFKCSDWMRDQVVDACVNLSDEQLDRPFEMGPGSIRATLSHIEDAERWWLLNWTKQSPGAFPKPDNSITITGLQHRFDQTATQRNAFLDELLSDQDLASAVETRPAPDRVFTFVLGVSMLQLCTHGTHHRAQLVNMLKHVGVEPPKTDLILMTRTASAPSPSGRGPG